MSQQMMRLRVAAQGVTVLLLVVGTARAGIDFGVEKKEYKSLPEADAPSAPTVNATTASPSLKAHQ